MKTYSLFFGAGSAGNVRGKQVAQFLGGKENPQSGFENDICIYVKVIPPANHPKHAYLDVDDSIQAVEYLKGHSDIGVIANSELGKDYLTKLLGRNDIIVIPHAHCNYENWVRPDREVKTVGIIGSLTSFMYPLADTRERLKKIGLDLIYNTDYWKVYGDEDGMSEDKRRMKVVDFYKSIDIQICWRPKAFSARYRPLKNPNKLVNAASFGIPTVAYPEECFLRGWVSDFVDAYSISNLVEQVNTLKEKKVVYQAYSERALEHAKDYHYLKIKQLYLNL